MGKIGFKAHKIGILAIVCPLIKDGNMTKTALSKTVIWEKIYSKPTK